MLQFLYEQSIGLDVKIIKAFILILIYVVIFPAIAAITVGKAIELIAKQIFDVYPVNATFQCINGIIIFKEIFQLFHFIGASFIISGIYLSNRKTQ